MALEDALIHVFCGHGTLPLGIGEGLVWCQAMRNASCQRDDAEWGCPCLFFSLFGSYCECDLFFPDFFFSKFVIGRKAEFVAQLIYCSFNMWEVVG